MLTHLPNLLTLFRIAVIPAIVGAFFLASPYGNWVPFALFAAAGVTDYLDGYLARSMNLSSALGRFLDPVADKLLISACILMLVASNRIAGVAVVAAVIILCREMLVSGLREFLAELRVSLPVSKLAKWKTTVQILALGFLMVGEASPTLIPSVMIGLWCLWLSAALTLITGYDYLRAGLRHMIDHPPPSA